MKTTMMQWVALGVSLLVALVAWCLVIFIALQVSEIVLATLHQIVELAGISP